MSTFLTRTVTLAWNDAGAGSFNWIETDGTRLPLNRAGYSTPSNAFKALTRFYAVTDHGTDAEGFMVLRLVGMAHPRREIAPRDEAFVGRMIDHDLAQEAKAREAARPVTRPARPASVVALESLNVALSAAALDRAGLPADTDLPTAPSAYGAAYLAIMGEWRREFFCAIEAAGRDAQGMSRQYVEGIAAAYARATAPNVATDGAGYQDTATAPAMVAQPIQPAQADASTFVALADVVAPIVARLTMAMPAQQAQGQDTRAASPILARLAEAHAVLQSAHDANIGTPGNRPSNREFHITRTKWVNAFEEVERLKVQAVSADAVAYVRAYPSHAFAYRHLLPLDMVARIEAAETDADIVQALRDPVAVVVTPSHHHALDYENARNVAAVERAYSTDAAMWADVVAAIAAGWQFDDAAARDGEWAWFLPMGEDDGRCVQRDGAWRLYVEGAAEALAEAGDAATVAFMVVGEGEAPAMVPQPVQQAQARDRRRPPAFLVRREARKAARRVYRPRASSSVPADPARIEWSAPTIRERLTRS